MNYRRGRWRESDHSRDSDLHDERDCAADFSSAESILDHAIVLTRDAINRPTSTRYTATLSPLARTMRRDLPYALRPVEGRPGWQMLTNRNYKPCGSIMSAGGWAVYEDWPSHHIYLPNGMDPEDPLAGWALFNDGSVPWFSTQNARAYLERLLRLRAAQRASPPARN